MKTTTQEIAVKIAAQLPEINERIATETDEHELRWLEIHRDNLLAIAGLCRALDTMGAEIARIALAPILPRGKRIVRDKDGLITQILDSR